MAEPAKDVVDGLMMFAEELRRNADGSMHESQDRRFIGRAMIVEAAAKEIKYLRQRLVRAQAKLEAIDR